MRSTAVAHDRPRRVATGTICPDWTAPNRSPVEWAIAHGSVIRLESRGGGWYGSRRLPASAYENTSHEGELIELVRTLRAQYATLNRELRNTLPGDKEWVRHINRVEHAWTRTKDDHGNTCVKGDRASALTNLAKALLATMDVNMSTGALKDAALYARQRGLDGTRRKPLQAVTDALSSTVQQWADLLFEIGTKTRLPGEGDAIVRGRAFRVIEGLLGHQGEIQSVRGFALRIFQNVAHDVTRSETQQEKVVAGYGTIVPPAPTTQEQGLVERQRMEALNDCMARLPPEDQAFMARYYEGDENKSGKDRTRFRRAKQRVQRCLAQKGWLELARRKGKE